MNLRDVQAATTDQTLSLGELSTDRRGRYMPEPAPLDPQMASLFRRAGLEAGQSYSLSELEQRMSAAQFDVEQRMAVKHFLSMSGRLRASSAAMKAAAETRPRGTILRNADGTLRTLRGCSW